MKNDISLLYAATGDAFARIRHEDGGWNVKLTLRDKTVQCLAVDPHDRHIVFAGSRGSGVWKSHNAGAEWAPLDLPRNDVFSLAVSSVDGAIYAGTEPSHLFVSHDGGASWRECEGLRDLPTASEWSFPPRPWTSHVRWIAPSPHDAELLIVGIELGGLMRSEDGGKSWLDHRPGAQKDVHALAWHPSVPGRAYEAAGGGAAQSRDGGITWTPADEGRERDYCWGLAVHPDNPETWFVSASSGPRAAHDAERNAEAAIYRRRDGGPWQPIYEGLSSFPYAMAYSGCHLFAGLGDGRILFTDDDGDTWTELQTDGDRIDRVQALVAV